MHAIKLPHPTHSLSLLHLKKRTIRFSSVLKHFFLLPETEMVSLSFFFLEFMRYIFFSL